MRRSCEERARERASLENVPNSLRFFSLKLSPSIPVSIGSFIANTDSSSDRHRVLLLSLLFISYVFFSRSCTVLSCWRLHLAILPPISRNDALDCLAGLFLHLRSYVHRAYFLFLYQWFTFFAIRSRHYFPRTHFVSRRITRELT